MKSKQYLIVIEKAKANYSAYAPDLPGCVATGRTIASVTKRMNTAIEWHLEAMRASGELIPEPMTTAQWSESRRTIRRMANAQVRV